MARRSRPDRLAPAACQRVESKTIIDPAGHTAAIAASSASRVGESGRWWLPGTSRVAPFSAVNSSMARKVLIDAR